MIRAAIMQRAGIINGLPFDCILAPQALQVSLLGDSSMHGITVVQVGSGQAFVRSKDVVN